MGNDEMPRFYWSVGEDIVKKMIVLFPRIRIEPCAFTVTSVLETGLHLGGMRIKETDV